MAAWITNRSAVNCYSAIELMVFIGMIDWSQWMLFLLLKKQNFLAKNNVCIYVLTTFRCAFVLVCKILSATGVTWIYAPLVVHHTEQQVL